MLQRKFDKIVKSHFPNSMYAKDTSIHYLGRMQIKHDIQAFLEQLQLMKEEELLSRPGMGY